MRLLDADGTGPEPTEDARTIVDASGAAEARTAPDRPAASARPSPAPGAVHSAPAQVHPAPAAAQPSPPSAAAAFPRDYYFLRHALPGSAGGSFHPREFERDVLAETDHGLSTRGRKQARVAGRRLRPLHLERIVSSTLRRAGETATLVAEVTGTPHLEQLEQLNEFVPGRLAIPHGAWLRLVLSPPWPAQARRVLDRALYAGFTQYYLLQWWRGLTSGGERLADIEQRIDFVLAALDRMPARRILVAGHGYWIFFLALRIGGYSWRTWAGLRWVANCSLTHVRAEGAGRHSLVSFARPLV